MVLSDDAFRQVLHKFDKKKNPGPGGSTGPRHEPPISSEARAESQSTGSESDEESHAPNPPTPPVHARDKPSGSRSKSMKRGASSSALSGPSAKK